MINRKVIINSQVYKLVPYGFCVCGCGQRTTVAARSDSRKKSVKGQPRKFIQGHNSSLRLKENHPRWNGGRKKHAAGYSLILMPEHPKANKTGYVMEHAFVCAKAFGSILPPNAVIHHVDTNRKNNEPSNLVICQNDAYHKLLHQRMRAYYACGHAHWLKCKICKQYDDPSNLYLWPNKRAAIHRECSNKRRKAIRDAERPVEIELFDDPVKTPVQRECAWCGWVMTPGTLPATHGICKPCNDRELAEAQRLIKEIKL